MSALVLVLSGCAAPASDVEEALDAPVDEVNGSVAVKASVTVAAAELEEEIESAPTEVSASVEVESSLPDGWMFFESKDNGYVLSAPMEFHLSGGMDTKTLANYDVNDVQYTRGNAEGLNIQIQTSSFEGSFEDKMVEMGNTPISLGAIAYSNYTADGPGGAFQQYFVEGADQNYYMILVFEPGYSSFKDLVESIVGTFALL